MSLTASTINTARKLVLAGKRNPLIATSAKTGQPCNSLLGDGRNLYLRVTLDGSMSWVFIWKTDGKRREMGLGSFTGVGAAVRLDLDQARAKADEVRATLARGIDPLANRETIKRAKASTFAVILADFLAKVPGAKGWKGGVDGAQVQVWKSGFAGDGKALMALPVDSIDTATVLRVLQPVWGSKKGEDLRNRIEQVLDYAKGHGHRVGLDNAATFKGNLSAALIAKPKASKKHHAALRGADMPAFWSDLSRFTGNGAKALAFCILTATRTDEAREALWSEIDLDAALWTIPAVRMKADCEHIVPLSTQAVALLRGLPRNGDLVFGGIGPTALSDKLCKDAKKGGMGYAGKATVHGMRSTFRDWVGDETTFDGADAEFCLAHGLEKTEGAYRRSTAVAKRRAIMQAWADYCHGQSNVIRLAA